MEKPSAGCKGLKFSNKVKSECKGSEAIGNWFVGGQEESYYGQNKMPLFECQTMVGAVRVASMDKIIPGKVGGV